MENKYFCEYCGNKNYHKIIDEKLSLYCHACSNVEPDIGNLYCILETNFKKKPTVSNSTNKYTKFDPTLPHIYLKCPNNTCATNVSKNVTDAIYLRHDNANMKYTYICTECDQLWTNN